MLNDSLSYTAHITKLRNKKISEEKINLSKNTMDYCDQVQI